MNEGGIMKPSIVIFLALAIFVAAGLASLRLVDGASSEAKASASPAAPCAPRALTLYGHIKSLPRSGANCEVRFDPDLKLSGATARQAALEDTGSGDVPNDAFIVEESHRAYLYLVPGNAHVTVLTRSDT